MAWNSFDEKFNAALANKLRNQDANAAANATTADAGMMRAETDRGLAPSVGLRNVAMGTADLMNAGTNRGQLAAANPMGFNSNQIGSFGLSGLGMRSTQQANTFGANFYGTNGQPSIPQQTYLDNAKKYGAAVNSGAIQPTLPGAASPTPALPVMQSVTVPSPQEPPNPYLPPKLARGGLIGRHEDNQGRDNMTVRAHPGEFFLNDATVRDYFGGGDHATGVRNLNEIVRQTTGQEPGATYSKKGKAGFDKGGEARKKGTQPADYPKSETPWFVPPDVQRGRDATRIKILMDEYENDPDPKNRSAIEKELRAMKVSLPGTRAQARSAPAPVSEALREHVLSRLRPMPDAPHPPASAPVDMTDAQWNALPGATSAPGPRTISEPYEVRLPAQSSNVQHSPPQYKPPARIMESGMPISEQLMQVDAINNPNRGVRAAPAPAAPVAPPAPVGAGFGMNDRGAGQIGATPSEIDERIRGPVPPVIDEANGGWAIRNAMQKGAAPGASIAVDYGAGHGGGPNSRPIVATADASGRFTQFGDIGRGEGLRTQDVPAVPRAGGDPRANAAAALIPDSPRMGPMYGPSRVGAAPPAPQQPPPGSSLSAFPQYPGAQEPVRIPLQPSLRMARGGVVPSFENSGQVLEPWMEEYMNLNEETAAQRAAGPNGETWIDRLKNRFARGAPSESPEAAARRTGENYKQIWSRATEPINAKELAQRAVATIKEYVPKAETVAKYGRGAAKVLTPVGAAMDAGEVADVYTDPKKTGIDVATDAASKVGRWGAAVPAAIYGGQLGSAGGPLLGLAGAATFGAGAYLGAGKLIEQGRKALDTDPQDPSATSQGLYRKLLGAGQATPELPNKPEPVVAPVAKQAAAPAGPAVPSFRDLMLMRAMALGGGGPAADAEQRNLLHYFGQVDSAGGRGDAGAATAKRAHEKDVNDKLAERYTEETTDEKGVTKKKVNYEKLARARENLTANDIDIYNEPWTKIDANLATFDNLDRVRERVDKRTLASGSPGATKTSRLQKVDLEGGLNFKHWWGNPDVDTMEYAKSFLPSTGNLRNTRAVVHTQDPVTGKPKERILAGTSAFLNEDGSIDLSAINEARGLRR